MGKHTKNVKTIFDVTHYNILGEAIDNEAEIKERASRARSRSIIFENGCFGLSGQPFIGDDDNTDAD